jgi:hypothetical protein
VPYLEASWDGKEPIDGLNTFEKLTLLDISIGGVALISYPERFALPLGKRPSRPATSTCLASAR